MVTMGNSFAHGSGHLLPKPQLHLAERTRERPWEKHARFGQAPSLVAAAAQLLPAPKSARHPAVSADADTSGKAAHFDAAVKLAALTSEELAGHAAKSPQATAKIEAPVPERFGPRPAASTDKPLTQLAYATPSQSGATGAAFSALLTAPLEDDIAVSQDPTVDEDAALPEHEDTPSVGPMPQFRPRGDQAAKPAAETDKSETGKAQDGRAPKTEETGKADERETPKQQKLAYARPDDPETSSGSGFGQALRNMFGGGARPGNGVAVYDITAAKVYMPDGSVLEAHSGIGKMADDPRYVNVKMTGPTPPHTYNLKMREARFHGVEAIRMLPVDGRNKHGRDGFLTHSYLLRGGRAESHGCVAFKDYPRFLAAFKQGKVRQIVVVPSGGRAAGLRLASNGRNT
ncbi:tlde1 domain-containing protein [Sinorhizobium terangae]|uniref:DUF2778 domain-containing protein n=2 Tax=Sinorhizobium terangae TaxID=110322 RepID=A0A6N7LA99_SINTE|nr:tlde1 domain-containing protein [Sinorhizobium terangae]MBB4187227.1 hypothetical protein [Sinorhizobium terangae]MQX14741.1 DUF2778 domain-containing protein [Sinorhizobium terangae]WFU50134.1 DUF2778 domain-containing protein [Sinorhizobium terangae]